METYPDTLNHLTAASGYSQSKFSYILLWQLILIHLYQTVTADRMPSVAAVIADLDSSYHTAIAQLDSLYQLHLSTACLDPTPNL